MSKGALADTLLSARWLIPIVPFDEVYENHALILNQGRIVELLPLSEALEKYPGIRHQHFDDQVLMPGLVNAHGHTPMSLFRGMSDDYPLMNWLQDFIWPAEGRWVGEDFVTAGSQLAIAEMLRSGTTCFSDMYFFPNKTAEAASAAGIRAQISFPVFDMASAWGSDGEDYIHKGLALRDRFKGHERITIGFGPHAPYTNCNENLEKVAMLSEELQSTVHIHVHETAHEISDSLKEHGKRPLQRLQDLGLLSPRTQCVHMTTIEQEDIELLNRTGAHVIHCPSSNLKLASGFCPVQTLSDHGINIALGTDGAASNNSLNMFSELRLAALLAKVVSSNASAVRASQALRMATLNGAIALGIDRLTGSLEPGKAADIIAVDLSALEFQPIYDPQSHLAYTQAGSHVSNLWIDGVQLLDNQVLTSLDEKGIIERAKTWASQIRTTTDG